MLAMKMDFSKMLLTGVPNDPEIAALNSRARGAILVSKISRSSVFFADEGKSTLWNRKILRSSITRSILGLKSIELAETKNACILLPGSKYS